MTDRPVRKKMKIGNTENDLRVRFRPVLKLFHFFFFARIRGAVKRNNFSVQFQCLTK